MNVSRTALCDLTKKIVRVNQLPAPAICRKKMSTGKKLLVNVILFLLPLDFRIKSNFFVYKKKM